MLTLRLPDGSTKQVPESTRPRDIAEGIGKRLAQAAVAAKLAGKVIDLDRELSAALQAHGLQPVGLEHPFQILTDKDRDALDVLRHSTAHIMARAVMRLFPGVQLAFGPTTDNGFYYDIDAPTPIREEDFPRIEEEMRKIIKQAEQFERFERPTAEARALCADLAQGYKVEHIDGELKQFPTLSFYRQGEFIDLCRGPHIPHAGKVGAFKLLTIAGAYWKNDASRKQLQRLYGTAFFTQKELDEYLKHVEEAKRRDHRVLGKQLGLFTISQQVGSGLILWMPKGATVRGILETFIKEELLKRGYQPVYTPHIGRLELYRTSGHFPYYRDAQFPPMFLHPLGQAVDTWLDLLEKNQLSSEMEQSFLRLVEAAIRDLIPPREPGQPLVGNPIIEAMRFLQRYNPDGSPEEKKRLLMHWLQAQEGYLLKPMNCPHHIQIYKAEPRSYRDLPVRLAEFGTVYRFEQTGELSGMTRVRGFTQDDAHLFVTPEQIEAEVGANIDLVLFVLSSLGLTDYRVRVGLRDPGSDKYVGSPENWDRAEKTLVDLARSRGMNYTAEKGEAAFYGPKIDFVVRDCIGREWQLGTVQLDYNLPERFQLEYIDKDNRAHRPVMIHRAPFGSMERFMGILIEHFEGAFPLWLAPEQVRVATISDKSAEYGRRIEAQLRDRGFRVTGDFRPEKIGAKKRDFLLAKIPNLVVVGERDAAAGTVAVTERIDAAGSGRVDRDLGAMTVPELIARLEREVQEKRIREAVRTTASLSETGGTKFED
jgi:threonyl-tRNA synthetase